MTSVPKILFCNASATFISTMGTCLAAAAWKTEEILNFLKMLNERFVLDRANHRNDFCTATKLLAKSCQLVMDLVEGEF